MTVGSVHDVPGESDPPVPDLFQLLDETALRADFDDGSIARGRLLAAQGAVHGLQLEQTGDRTEAVASVQGSSPVPYRVHIWLHADSLHGVATTTSCTCPVSRQCKHGVAVSLAARELDLRSARPEWERSLDVVLDELGDHRPKQAGDPAPLALQLELLSPTVGRAWRDHGDPVILLRPMRRGAKGDTWVKSGVGWSRLVGWADWGAYVPEHVEVLTQLHAAAAGRRSYVYGNDQIVIGDVGPRLWTLLRTARDLGVELLSAGALSGVEVLDEPVEMAVDLRRADEGATEVVLGVQALGRWWTGDPVLPVGLPAHGVVLLERVAEEAGRGAARGRGGPSYVARLAGLTRPVPAATLRLGRSPLLVPRAERESLETGYLPRLVRQLRVGSSDSSVRVPAPLPPRLLLEVTWSDADAAELVWRWGYGSGRTRQTCDLGDRTALPGLRDEEAEQKLLAEVLATGHVDRLVPASGRLPERLSVSGAAALALGRWVLPALRGSDLVEVTEVEPPVFREAEGVPQIRFDAVEPPRPEGGSAATDWLDLSVVIEIDGEQVPLPAVLAALTLGDEMIVLPSGLFFTTDRPELARLRELVAAAAEIHGDSEDDEETLRVSLVDVDTWAQLEATGLVDRQAEEWLRRAAVLRDLTELPAHEPVGLTATLRGYQLDGFRWLAFLREHGLGGILADDMGLGKTLQVLAMISHAQAADPGPFLVVAPTSVVGAWEGEAARHAPDLRVLVLTSSVARRGGPEALAALAAEADVVVTSYTLLRLDEPAYAAITWGGLVLDEAQHVKNHKSKGYQAVRRIEAPFKLAVTGTPFENRLMELWSLLSITNPGLYPWPARFSRHVVRPVEAGERDVLQRLQRRIRPFLLRRTKEVVAADLPPKQEQVLEVELAPRHRRAYDTHLQRERQRILGLLDDFAENRIAIFAALTRLRLLALHAGLVDEAHDTVASAKLDLLVDHLRELAAEGHRALVFSQFTSFLARVRDRLDAEGIATSYLDGSTRDRPSVVEGFRSGADPVFLISLKAGGVGLTLTEADYVFVLDPWWNPAVEAQAVDRAHRIGQTKPVIVYRLVATDTIEEKVMALKERKARLFADVIDGEGGFGAAVGVDDIRGLLGEE